MACCCSPAPPRCTSALWQPLAAALMSTAMTVVIAGMGCWHVHGALLPALLHATTGARLAVPHPAIWPEQPGRKRSTMPFLAHRAHVILACCCMRLHDLIFGFLADTSLIHPSECTWRYMRTLHTPCIAALFPVACMWRRGSSHDPATTLVPAPCLLLMPADHPCLRTPACPS